MIKMVRSKKNGKLKNLVSDLELYGNMLKQ